MNLFCTKMRVFFVVTQYNTNRKVIEKIFGKNVK